MPCVACVCYLGLFLQVAHSTVWRRAKPQLSTWLGELGEASVPSETLQKADSRVFWPTSVFAGSANQSQRIRRQFSPLTNYITVTRHWFDWPKTFHLDDFLGCRSAALTSALLSQRWSEEWVRWTDVWEWAGRHDLTRLRLQPAPSTSAGKPRCRGCRMICPYVWTLQRREGRCLQGGWGEGGAHMASGRAVGSLCPHLTTPDDDNRQSYRVTFPLLQLQV